MNLSLTAQLQGFVIAIAAGVFLGAYYDIFRIFRTVFQSERRAVFFQDLFYMVTAAFVTFLLALGVNYGEVRFYILAGEGIGWCLYYLTVGTVTYRVFRFIAGIVRKFVIVPVKKLLAKISHLLLSVLKKIGKNTKIVASNLKKRLKHHREIVYNHFKAKPEGKKKKKRKKTAKLRRRR
ncbi:spore cortex biosynthesis protein YabQ [Caproiciproducens sp. CPB-2]|uniref:spore cortex biosynthesis protein YabQ n=1 Tax=Caproiciproducens sp. CPB-2 TaxID=3030017 RepID=UPI0023DC6548|nr:spore cortex biosynthesis protein YabQ [Caproiciproducens sp. CPB-2]MDF1495775.1 spore cortex biosynthesis protein YabQ [Caproiciproducens sp. CPB-2]